MSMGVMHRKEYYCNRCDHHFIAHGELKYSQGEKYYTGEACKEVGCRCQSYTNKGITLKVEKIHPNARIPTKAYEGDACFDLYTVEEVQITNIPTKVRFGIRWEIPKGYEGVIRPRSSSFLKKMLNVFIGTVDQQYRGEIVCVVSTVVPNDVYTVKVGESIAQLALREVPVFNMFEVDQLEESERGENGWGSTG